MTPPVIRDFGDRALLLECDCTETVLAVTAAVRAADPAGLADVVPAARTVLVSFAVAEAVAPARRALASLSLSPAAAGPPPDDACTVIEVRYDGADLAAVADHTGMSADAVVAAHTATPWRVAFTGFAPGFAYLVGGDPRLRVPRRAEPRSRVPAGSVALAGEFSGIYPRASPGGWQLIGRTDAVLWDPQRSDPALLTPGLWVRFRAVRR